MEPVVYKSIEEEAADCRAAFAGLGIGTPSWNVHHSIQAERLAWDIEDRIRCIMEDKPEEERSIRLRELRPIKDAAAYYAWEAKRAALDAKQRPERAALYAKQRTERDALDAKQRTEWAALDAKQRPERAALYAKLTEQHRREYPETVWDGRTILPNRKD